MSIINTLLSALAALALLLNVTAFAAEKEAAKQATVEDLGMERFNITRPDSMQWIFNGGGRTFPRRWSLTGFDGLGFIHDDDGYRFHFDFIEKRSGFKIIDNVYELMPTQDPCGWNFRKGAPYCLVPQDDTWYPHFERKTGTFQKEFQTGRTSFSIETRTLIPARVGEVLLEMSIENRDAAPLTLTLVPMQNGTNTLAYADKKGVDYLATDLNAIQDQSLEWTIPAHTKQTHYFAVTQYGKDEKPPATYQPDLAQRIEQADRDGEKQIDRIAGRLPVLQTANKELADLYKRCLVSMAFCRWDYPGARCHPVWMVGGFQVIVSWDFSFVGDTLSLIEPQAVRQVIFDVLGIGQMKNSYIDPDTAHSANDILYVQDPFALQTLITSYMKITGDRAILDEVTGGNSVYDWLKQWAAKLDTYANKSDGLLDVGDGNELLLELRTDGYDHIVPTLNGLTIEYLRWLARLAKERHDPDAVKFTQRADALDHAFQQLWNEKAGWFDNRYADGSRQPFYSMHLFDLLGASCVTPHQKQAIASHFVEGEFLAPLGIYSISKKDTVHWDRFDQDWGGGGCYIGTPFRTARLLYENGDAAHGWEILKRTARLAEHFSYMPQSPAVDEPFEWRLGGNLNVSSGAAFEAIWSGIFGLRPQADGSMVVHPAPYNKEIGAAKLTGFQFRGHRYDVALSPAQWQVTVDGKSRPAKSYGESLTLAIH